VYWVGISCNSTPTWFASLAGGRFIVRLLLGICCSGEWTQPIAACLEGKQSPLRAKYRQALEDENHGRCGATPAGTFDTRGGDAGRTRCDRRTGGVARYIAALAAQTMKQSCASADNGTEPTGDRARLCAL
jgi:hypothetical protein